MKMQKILAILLTSVLLLGMALVSVSAETTQSSSTALAASDIDWDIVDYDFDSAPAGVVNEGTVANGLLSIAGTKSFYTAAAAETMDKIYSEISLRAVSGWVNIYFANKISGQGYHIQVRADGDVLLFGGSSNAYIDAIGKNDPATGFCKITFEMDLDEDEIRISVNGGEAKEFKASTSVYYASNNTDTKGYSRVAVMGHTAESSVEVDYIKVASEKQSNTGVGGEGSGSEGSGGEGTGGSTGESTVVWDIVDYDFDGAPTGVVNEGTVANGLLSIAGTKSFYTAAATETTDKIYSEISLRAVSGWVNIYFANKITAQGYHIQVRADGDVLLFGGSSNAYIDAIGKNDPATGFCKITFEMDLDEDEIRISVNGGEAKEFKASTSVYYTSTNTDTKGYSRVAVMGHTAESSVEVDYIKVASEKQSNAGTGNEGTGNEGSGTTGGTTGSPNTNDSFLAVVASVAALAGVLVAARKNKTPSAE